MTLVARRMPSNFVVRGVLLVGQLAVPKGLSRPVLAVGHLAHDATAVYAELENSDLSQKVAFLERELAAAKRTLALRPPSGNGYPPGGTFRTPNNKPLSH